MMEEIDASDYKIFKKDCESEMKSLELQITNFSPKPEQIENLMEQALDRLSRLDILYDQGSTVQKREIISSVFPGKLTFDGSCYRTFRINEAVRLIYIMGKGFSKIKNETTDNFLQMSRKVSSQRLELWTR